MSYTSLDDLYKLLPALYRLRDVGEGYPLKAFLRVITEQVQIVQQNIDRLCDDFAIETCQAWVIPYIGDLVGNNLLHDAGARARVDVARTIYYRRRKGTLPMLEELARDVTGWGCHAVEFFEILGWTQNLNHLRMFNFRTPDLRDVDTLDRLDGPFDQIAHTVDVRPPSIIEGWHNIRNIGFFLYRLGSYPLCGTQARQAQAPNQHGYHFSTLGAPGPLFNHWQREGDEAGLATEPFVPGQLRPLAFHFDLERYRAALAAGTAAVSDYTGPGLSLAVYKDGVRIPTEQVMCKNLSNWDRPPAGRVAVDVTLGRITFAAGEEPAQGVIVEYHYGFSDDTGGGPYDRRRKTPTPGDPLPIGPDTILDPTAFGTLIQVPSAGVNTLADALTLWTAAGSPPAVIQVEDDRTYVENVTIPMAGNRLTLQAANYRRPTLIGAVTITGNNPDARLGIDGLSVEGHLHLQGDLKEFRLAHSTLVPGRALDENGGPQFPDQPSLIAEASNISLTLLIERCLTGALRLPVEMVALDVRDSLLEGNLIAGVRAAAIARLGGDDEAGPPTSLRRVTVLGPVHVRELELATEVIFTDTVHVERTQNGCVRFSYVALTPETRTPRRYQCQPELVLARRAKELGLASASDLPPGESAIILARLRPAFTSIHYGQPGYGQLSLNAPAEIKTGAEDGAEMGVFCSLRQPQREANLKIRLEEYLPFGLQPALIYVT